MMNCEQAEPAPIVKMRLFDTQRKTGLFLVKNGPSGLALGAKASRACTPFNCEIRSAERGIADGKYTIKHNKTRWLQIIYFVMHARVGIECRNPFRVANLFCHVTPGRLCPSGPPPNRANPGLSDTIPSGLKMFRRAIILVDCQERTRGRKYLISRQLGSFFTFFTPFLSHKGLISRRLQRNALNFF
jgi:hypothetical protein